MEYRQEHHLYLPDKQNLERNWWCGSGDEVITAEYRVETSRDKLANETWNGLPLIGIALNFSLGHPTV
jgi:hypothetical protein